MDVRISVIIPIYNVERYIRECLQSVSRQSFSAYEVLMVDDGSTDESGKICDMLACSDNRVTVIHKKMVDFLMPEMLVWKLQPVSMLAL